MNLPINSATTLETSVPVSVTGDAVYLYAFFQPACADDLLAGLAEYTGVFLHVVGEVGAIVSLVPVADFSGGDAERNLADPAWIMPRVHRHAALLDRALEHTPVFPTGFATLYGDLARLTLFMVRNTDAIAAFLRQVTGLREWGLKLTAKLDDPALIDQIATELWPGWLDCTPGTRYLRLRKERPILLEAARARVGRLVPGFIDRLRPSTAAARPIVRSEASQVDEHRFLEDYALLIPRAGQAALEQRLSDLAAELADAGLKADLSGPWPPFSFRPVLDSEQRQQSV